MGTEYVPKEELDTILPFLPVNLREFLYYSKEDSLVPNFIECYGVVMSIQVSGYDNIKNEIESIEKDNWELFSKTLNSYYDELSKTIKKYNGDIVRFSVDKIIILWSIDSQQELECDTPEDFENVKAYSILRACQCALDMLRELNNYPIKIPDYDKPIEETFLLKFAIGSGTLYHLFLGGPPDKWIYSITGNSLSKLDKVFDLAKPGQLAITYNAMKTLSRFVHVTQLNIVDHIKGTVILENNEVNVVRLYDKYISEDDLCIDVTVENDESNPSIDLTKVTRSVFDKWKHFVHENVIYKINHDLKIEQFNEWRRITTVLVKVSNIVISSPSDFSMAQEIINAIYRSLINQEGIVRHIDFDENGIIIVIDFGLPPYSHDNDAQIGIDVAFEIINNTKRITENIRIAISTGDGWIGTMGSEKSVEYVVYGNLNRITNGIIMKARNGTIICDEETNKLTKDNITYEERGTIATKSSEFPIKLYSPVGNPYNKLDVKDKNKLHEALDIELIGRQKEIEKLHNIIKSYNEVMNNQLIIIEGIEGYGTSLLAKHMMNEAYSNRINILYSAPRKAKKTVSYFAYRSIIQDIIVLAKKLTKGRASNINKKNGIEEKKRNSTDLLNDEKSSIENDLNILLNFMGESRDYITLFSIIFSELEKYKDEKTDPQIQANELNSLILRILVKLSYKIPLLLCIDQIQFMDFFSWRLTECILKCNAKILITLVTYPESSYPSNEKSLEIFQGILKMPKAIIITLNGISEDAACEMIKDACTVKFAQKCTGVSQSILEIIYERTQGAPTYIKRMISWLLELPSFYLATDGSLRYHQDSEDPQELENVIPFGGIETVVVNEFDKLDTNFQNFLRVATVLAQFKLSDVKKYIVTQDYYSEEKFPYLNISDENEPPNMETLFADYDKYNFLRLVVDEKDNYQESIFSFVSDMVQQAIYKMMTNQVREEIHMFYAKYYEGLYEEDTQKNQELLSTIYEHYSHTNDKINTKKYLEMVCQYFYKIKSMTETLKYYRLLLRMYETDQYTFPFTISNWKISEWHCQIAEAYLSLLKYHEAENHIVVALLLINIRLPEKKLQTWWAEKKVNFNHYLICKRNFNTTETKSEKTKHHAKINRRYLLVLCETYNTLHKLTQFRMAIKMAIKWSSYLEPDPNYAQILSMYGLDIVTNINNVSETQVSMKALQKAEEILAEHYSPLTSYHLYAYDCLAQAYFALGDWQRAFYHWETLINMSGDLGEMYLGDKAWVLKSFTEFHGGYIERSMKTAVEMFNKRKLWKTQCLALSLILFNYTSSNEEEEMSVILSLIKKICSLGQSPNTGNFSVQLIFYGLICEVFFRFNIEILEDTWNSLARVVRLLDRLSHASWGTLVSLPHFINILYLAYDQGIFESENDHSIICLGILFTLTHDLERFFNSYIIALPMLALCRGLYQLINGNINNALVEWRSGLIDESSSPKLRTPYYNAVLYTKIAQYTPDDTERENMIKSIETVTKTIFQYDLFSYDRIKPEDYKKPLYIDQELRNRVYQRLLKRKENKPKRSRNGRPSNQSIQSQVLQSMDIKSSINTENIHSGMPGRNGLEPNAPASRIRSKPNAARVTIQ